MPFENITFHTGEVPDDHFLKRGDERTELTYRRNTDLTEEHEALKKNYEAFPEYFPEPYFAIEDETGLAAVGMERLDLETNLEYATMEGYTTEEAEAIYSEALEVVSQLHQRPDLEPHGDLIGNVFIADGSPVFIDPMGIPESREEEKQWVMDDEWQMDWIHDSIK
jgi:serine/threonine-protein kinase RIO1